MVGGGVVAVIDVRCAQVTTAVTIIICNLLQNEPKSYF